MTTIDSPSALNRRQAPAGAAGAPTDSRAEHHLRLVLRANAVSSALFGLVGLVGAGFWSERFGLEPVALTAAVAVGLVVFAIDVWWIARQPVARLRPLSLAVSAADLAWVAASVAVIAMGVLTTTGAVAAILVAVLVSDFALTQLWFRHRLGRP